MFMIMINNLKINVENSGVIGKNIILLHGWGQNTKAFKSVVPHLKTKFNVYNIDLPGFGLSDKPNYPFDTGDYSNILKKIIDKYNITDPIIIGHSFGGRVAIKYTSKDNNVLKLVLVDSSGIVHKKKFKFYFKVYTFKILKSLFKFKFMKKYKERLLNKFGSNDYKNADEMMKKVLVKVVNEDLRKDLVNIKCPTLLIWGMNDTTTPINDAYIMNEHLQDSGVVEISNAGHFSYLDDLRYFLLVLDEFLK